MPVLRYYNDLIEIDDSEIAEINLHQFLLENPVDNKRKIYLEDIEAFLELYKGDDRKIDGFTTRLATFSANGVSFKSPVLVAFFDYNKPFNTEEFFLSPLEQPKNEEYILAKCPRWDRPDETSMVVINDRAELINKILEIANE